jgi:uncharacterized membrane protein
MKSQTTTKLAAAGIVAAAYAALTVALSFIAYGPIQFRVSEVLCVLPYFFPATAPGVFIGCVLANLMSPAGPLDIIFGSLATLLAVLCAAWIGSGARKSAAGESSWGRCVAVCSLPVLFNAPIVGAVLAYTLVDELAFWQAFLLYGAQVGLGELVVMFALALPLMRLALGNRKLMTLAARLR